MSDSYDGPEYGEFAWESVTELEPEGDGTFEITVRLREYRSGYWKRAFTDALRVEGPERAVGTDVAATSSSVTVYGVRAGQEQDLRDSMERAARAADAEAQRQQAVADDMAITFRRLAGFPPRD